MMPLALKEIVEERKEKAIESLSDSYAKNRLPLEEYERLAEYIHKIESEREMVVVEKIVAEYSREEEPRKPAQYDDDDEPEYFHGNPNMASNMSVLSTRVFSGPIKPGSQFVSILGSGQIKVRKSDLEKKRTVLNVVSILGDNTVFVESGIRVSNRTIPILGSSEVSSKIGKQTREGDPELVISGMALLGNISVRLLKD